MSTYEIPVVATKPKTLSEWARFLGCSVETLRRAYRRKELLATRQPLAPGRTLEATPADMRAFLEKRRAR